MCASRPTTTRTPDRSSWPSPVKKERSMSDDYYPDEFRDAGDAVLTALLERVGESSPEPRLQATRRAVELLGDPQNSYPIIHITGTNGKSSTSRIVESILRAYGLRTG